MFKFKRNFSVRESPIRLTSSSPMKIEASPIKRIRLSSTRLSNSLMQIDDRAPSIFQQSNFIASRLSEARELNLVVDKIETPPATPIAPNEKFEKFESKVDRLNRENAELEVELREMDQIIEKKYQSIREKKEKIADNRSKRFIVDDYTEIAIRSQLVVRNLLNEIYNPGKELADRASALFEEAKRNHAKKFEKFAFELTNLMETTRANIQQKAKQINHDIALHERTLMTIESKANGLNLTEEPELEAGGEGEPEPQTKPMSQSAIEEKTDNLDDDCVIIDAGTVASGLEPAEDDDDERTDISSQKEEEEERSFTPCQAQRPE